MIHCSNAFNLQKICLLKQTGVELKSASVNAKCVVIYLAANVHVCCVHLFKKYMSLLPENDKEVISAM